MKPLSEKELREKIVELVSREPSNPEYIAEQVLDLILSDRKAWIEQTRSVVADYILSEGCSCCQDYEVHDRSKAKLLELLDIDNLRIHSHEYRKRNQGEKTDE